MQRSNKELRVWKRSKSTESDKTKAKNITPFEASQHLYVTPSLRNIALRQWFPTVVPPIIEIDTFYQFIAASGNTQLYFNQARMS